MTFPFEGRYAKEFLAGWATMDINGHMANTYFREVGLHETVTVTYALLAMSADGARFVIENEIWSAGWERAATVRSTGGWLDLRARKLVAPPPALLEIFAKAPRAPGFVELPPHAKREPLAAK